MPSLNTALHTSFTAHRPAWPRLLPGGLLLAASLLKFWQIFQTPLAPAVNPVDFILARGLPALELLWALWLFSGKRPQWALAVTAAGFAVFSIYTLHKITQGSASCGCFGAWEVRPQVTYWVDVGAFFVAASALTQRWFAGGRPGWRAGFFLGAVLGVAVGLYAWAVNRAPQAPSPPGQWVGQTWPTPGALDTVADFRAGRWVVVLFNASCGRCQAVADDYADLAQLWRSERREIGVALISTVAETAPVSAPEVATGRFHTTQPYGTPPVVLVVADGKIVAAHEGRDSVDWTAPPFAAWLVP
jgi:hypothetical protein